MLILGLCMAAFITVAEAQEGDKKVPNEDGTLSYPDRGLPLGTTEWVGDVLWQYTGMTRYGETREAWGEQVVVPDAAPAEDPSREAKIIGSIKRDGLGQEWVAIDAVVSNLKDYSHLLDEEPVPEPYVWTPNAGWETHNCDGDGVAIYDGESREQFSSVNQNRQYRIAMIVFADDEDPPNKWGCTGVQTDEGEILTNAHCTTDYNTSAFNVHVICSRGNTYSFADCMTSPPGGFDIFLNSGWSGGSFTVQNDYSLIQWSTSGTTEASSLAGLSTSGFALSEMDDTTIESERLGEYGHPHETYEGDVCNEQKDETPADSQYTHGWYMSFDWREDDHWVDNNLLKTRMDCSDGQSGAPYFACPTNSANCANGEEIVGLHSGAYWPWPSARYCGGPKTAVFADFVQVN